jgi:hypothetical protein
MATTFRTSFDVLIHANEAFIEKIQRREALKETMPIIVPELERLWKEKVSADPGDLPNFEGYLCSFTPQLLRRAIHTTPKYADSPKAYFKSVVMDLRRKQIAVEQKQTS